jgi:hypothetical protein
MAAPYPCHSVMRRCGAPIKRALSQKQSKQCGLTREMHCTIRCDSVLVRPWSFGAVLVVLAGFSSPAFIAHLRLRIPSLTPLVSLGELFRSEHSCPARGIFSGRESLIFAHRAGRFRKSAADASISLACSDDVFSIGVGFLRSHCGHGLEECSIDGAIAVRHAPASRAAAPEQRSPGAWTHFLSSQGVRGRPRQTYLP